MLRNRNLRSYENSSVCGPVSKNTANNYTVTTQPIFVEIKSWWDNLMCWLALLQEIRRSLIELQLGLQGSAPAAALDLQPPAAALDLQPPLALHHLALQQVLGSSLHSVAQQLERRSALQLHNMNA